MSLEKLKSVFSDISKFENLNVSIHTTDTQDMGLLPPKPEPGPNPKPIPGDVGDIPWWRRDTSDYNIDGTPSFDSRSLSDIYLQFSANQPVVETQAVSAGGGFNFNFNNLFDLATGGGSGFDDVFSLGNTKLMVSDHFYDASLYYIDTAMGETLALDTTIGSFGKLSETVTQLGSKVGLPGLSIPNIDASGFIEDINPFNNQDLIYQNQVYELFNDSIPSDADAIKVESAGSSYGMPRFKNPYRGVAFQVLGENKKGKTDFTYMDQVENEFQIRSPIASWKSGEIKFKPIDLNIDIDIDIDLPSLPDIDPFDFPELPNIDLSGIGNMIGGGFGALGGGFGTVFQFTDDMITGIWGSIHGIFPSTNMSLSGWGNPIKFPKFDFFSDISGINFSPAFDAVGDALSSAGDFLGGVADTVGNAISNAAGAVGGALADMASNIKISPFNIISGEFNIGNLNPIESLKLPQIELQNPFKFTDFGGQGQLLNDQGPRHERFAASIPMRKFTPSETKDEGVLYNEGKIGPYSSIGKKYWDRTNTYYPQNMDATNGGDVHTYTALTKGMPNTDFFKIGSKNVIEDEEFGMPFYFYDLRDKTYVTFRAYIEALTEQLSPSWSSENYIGRSEPVYIYERTERSIDFTLKLFAQTAVELDSIYSKLRRLTSLTYPEYKPDWNSAVIANMPLMANDQSQVQAKIRMKPPLMRLRIGELYGRKTTVQDSVDLSGKNDVLGFIKSLSYSVPDNSPWEYRKGQRVPKHIVATIGYQVIHDNPPNMHTNFYGYQGSSAESV